VSAVRSIGGAELAAWFREMQAVAIAPNADKIATIVAGGDVAVALYHPDTSALAAARGVGWDGSSAFRMPRTAQKRLAAQSQRSGDVITSRWLRRSGEGGRIFLISGTGTLLINCDECGLSIEPGSLSNGWMS